jgi:hypothetical protein
LGSGLERGERAAITACTVDDGVPEEELLEVMELDEVD